jgi:SRSO17 transposase
MGTRRIDTLAREAPPEAWTRISAGEGTKGPRLYDWAAVRISAWWDEQEGVGHWALIRRSISDQTEMAFYLCARPIETPIEELVRVAGARWAIEECFQAAKNHTGLDQYEVRSYRGWYRHATLSMLAHAFLAALAAAAAAKGEPPNLPTNTHHSPWARSDGSWQV